MPKEYHVTNTFDNNLFSLSEEDIKNRYITPAIEAKGWSKNQTRMEFTIKENSEFTDGKIIIKGRKAKSNSPLL